MARGSISAKDKGLHLLLRVKNDSEANTASYSASVGDLSSGVKRPGREVKDLLLSSDTIRNEWTRAPYISTARTGKTLRVPSQF